MCVEAPPAAAAAVRWRRRVWLRRQLLWLWRQLLWQRLLRRLRAVWRGVQLCPALAVRAAAVQPIAAQEEGGAPTGLVGDAHPGQVPRCGQIHERSF